MWLLLVHGKQELLGVGPVCDMGLPRFQQILLVVKVLVVSLYEGHRMVRPSYPMYGVIYSHVPSP